MLEGEKVYSIGEEWERTVGGKVVFFGLEVNFFYFTKAKRWKKETIDLANKIK